MPDHYDVIIVGTGFASSFFLMRYLEHAPPQARILVLERGNEDTKAWQLANQLHTSIDPDSLMENDNPGKEWYTSPGFGGNSKCWMGGTTRMMPGDFKLKSRYGVGSDWPISYDDLEPHYGVAEQVMLVSGPTDSPMPRSRPAPLLPHRFSDPDALLKKHFPDGWYQMSTARASVATGKRGICCASGICGLCPVDAKFTIQNGLAEIYKDPRVTLQLRSEVQTVDTAAGVAQAVNYLHEKKDQRATADLIVLGASALFNPHILLRSGFSHPLIGRRLHEQMSVYVTVDLKGVKCYNGSTVLTGLGYLFYEGDHRAQHAACMIETWSSPFAYRPDGALRLERGRWNERMMMGFLFDDLPDDKNRITVSTKNPSVAHVHFEDFSEYTLRAADRIPQMVDKLAEALPIERLVSTQLGTTAAHIQGTVVMGDDPATSVVDRHLIHHEFRNLLILGSSAYPTASPAYPTLTVSALSLWAADHLLGEIRVIKRRRLILGGLGLFGVVALGSWGAGRLGLQAEIASVLRRKLSFLKLDPDGVHAFAKDQTNAAFNKKIPTYNRLRYHLLAAAMPSFKRNFRSIDKRSRLAKFEDNLVANYLLSSDFFLNGADESRTVKYVAYYDALRPCQNPFARPATDA